MRDVIDENARTAVDQECYKERYDALTERYETLRLKINTLQDDIFAKKVKADKIKAFIETLKQRDSLIEKFDEGLWNATVDEISVGEQGDLRFVFRDGD